MYNIVYRIVHDCKVENFSTRPIKFCKNKLEVLIVLTFIMFTFSGEYNKIINLLLEGYNYILNLDSDKDILTLAKSRGHSHTSTILQNIPNFVVKIKTMTVYIFN